MFLKIVLSSKFLFSNLLQVQFYFISIITFSMVKSLGEDVLGCGFIVVSLSMVVSQDPSPPLAAWVSAVSPQAPDVPKSTPVCLRSRDTFCLC